MAKLDKSETVTLQELLVTSLAQTDAVAKLLIEKGLITEAEGGAAELSGLTSENEVDKILGGTGVAWRWFPKGLSDVCFRSLQPA